MFTALAILYVCALVTGILTLVNPPKCPPGVPIILLSIAGLLTVLPKG